MHPFINITERKKDSESFLLSTSDGMELIDCANLVRIEAISNYSKLYFSNGKTLVVAKVLAWFENLLSAKGFVRLHRSHLVNILYIRGFSNSKNWIAILRNDEQVTVAKRKKQFVKQAIHSYISGPVPAAA